MTTIAPQVLSCEPTGADPAIRLGVSLIGLGGFGVSVVERLQNRFQGQPETIGLHPTWVDAVVDDGYSSPTGTWRLAFTEAEPRNLRSDGNYAAILEHIAAGNAPEGAP